ncbi:MAG: response regulator [Symbiobacteriia bacterium]
MADRVLVVDDEPSIVELAAFNLRRAGFDVLTAADGPAALEAVRALSPQVVVLDVMLPGLDGFEVCRQLRQWSTVPVLMLTARKDEVDRVVGLEIGADDYLTKPFSPRELVARVKALVRRVRLDREAEASQGPAEVIRTGSVSIDLTRHEVRVAGRFVELTPTEFSLLAHLASHPGRVYSRGDLLKIIWGEDFFGDERTVDVHIRHMREKLEGDPAQPALLLTVRGVGYRFNPGSQGEPA